MAQPLGVAVLGASGFMGQMRLNQFLGDPRCRVVAAYARDLRKLSEAVPEPAVKLVARPEEIYADPEVQAVVLCLPNALHYGEIKQALQAGKHVHCEYPLTDNLEQFDELVELAQAQGKVLHHALTARAESLHLTLKSVLEGLGTPRMASYRYYGTGDWYVDPRLRGDLICALHIHFIDQFVDLFGQPEKIKAHGTEADMKPSAVVTLYWPDGLVGTIELAMGLADRPAARGTIVTTDGWCEFETENETQQVTVCEGGQTGTLVPGPDTSKEEDAASFLDQILGTGGPLVDLETTRNTLGLCLAGSAQLHRG